MKIDIYCEPEKRGQIGVELEGEELRVVKANRDGTYQILVFTGKDYRLFTRAKITAFESYDDSEGIWCKMTTKEIWDSWGRDLPEERKARPATQIEWVKFFEEDKNV